MGMVAGKLRREENVQTDVIVADGQSVVEYNKDNTKDSVKTTQNVVTTDERNLKTIDSSHSLPLESFDMQLDEAPCKESNVTMQEELSAASPNSGCVKIQESEDCDTMSEIPDERVVRQRDGVIDVWDCEGSLNESKGFGVVVTSEQGIIAPLECAVRQFYGLEYHSQTIDLFLSGNIPDDLVNSYLKQHAPSMQATYLELMLSMNEDGISQNLQNEMLHIYLSEVLDWYADLNAKKEWDEKIYTATTKKLISALQSISDYNPGNLLKRIPKDALYEERAILLGKMNQHKLALSIYVHKVTNVDNYPDMVPRKQIIWLQLHFPGMALSYCDRVYEAGLNQQPGKTQGNIYLPLMQVYLNPRKKAKNVEKRITSLVSSPSSGNLKAGLNQQPGKTQGNIYLPLMQVYLNPRKKAKNVEKRITSLVSSPSSGNLKAGWSAVKAKGKGLRRKIAEIEGAEDTRIRAYSSDGGRSDYDTDDVIDEGSSTIMLDEVLDVLIQRWDRVQGAKALRLLPKETKLQNLYPFLGPLMKKTSESYRNFSVIKSLRQLENVQIDTGLLEDLPLKNPML
ncbi:Citron-like protein [Artemisia annua]|uniref:Citron-like protein n=1 Tax=Artemisia annua TaxID=35608 RepID=A0A2U1PN32_ARTAN|nr:Citron-like protein [Artemisia annua]